MDRPLLLIAVALALVASACSSSDSAEPSLPTLVVSGGEEEPEPADFRIDGADIVDPEGNLFVPVGANVGAPVLDGAGQPVWLHRHLGHDITSEESVAAVEAWGWNLLRVNARCAEVEANADNAAWGHDEMLAAIDRVVDTYTARGVVVLVACHDLTGQSPSLDDPIYAEVQAFWAKAAERYGDNTWVWFNHLNEFDGGPAGPDVDGTADGGGDDAERDGFGYWQRVVEDGYEVFASIGVDNIVVFDLPNYGNDLLTLTDPRIEGWADERCNTIYGWHSYGGIQPPEVEVYDANAPDEEAFRSTVEEALDRIVDAGLPVLVGELGYDWDGARQASNFAWASERLGALTALELAPRRGIGLVAWHANGDSALAMTYGLKTGDDLVFSQPTPDGSLSELGERFWAHSQDRRGQAPVAAAPGEPCFR